MCTVQFGLLVRLLKTLWLRCAWLSTCVTPLGVALGASQPQRIAVLSGTMTVPSPLGFCAVLLGSSPMAAAGPRDCCHGQQLHACWLAIAFLGCFYFFYLAPPRCARLEGTAPPVPRRARCAQQRPRFPLRAAPMPLLALLARRGVTVRTAGSLAWMDHGHFGTTQEG